VCVCAVVCAFLWLPHTRSHMIACYTFMRTHSLWSLSRSLSHTLTVLGFVYIVYVSIQWTQEDEGGHSGHRNLTRLHFWFHDYRLHSSLAKGSHTHTSLTHTQTWWEKDKYGMLCLLSMSIEDILSPACFSEMSIRYLSPACFSEAVLQQICWGHILISQITHFHLTNN
jgi:hypothetical protein